MRPSSFLRGCKKNKALSNVLFTAPFFLISSHALRYHDLDASLRPYTDFLSCQRSEVFASRGGQELHGQHILQEILVKMQT